MRRAPTILRETPRRMGRRMPPPSSAIRPHPWLDEAGKQRYERWLVSGRPFPLYLTQTVSERIRRHAERGASQGREVLGLLVGEVWRTDGETYAVARDTATTALQATAFHVRFDRRAFARLFAALDRVGYEYILVGWYHSHPGYGCFLSPTDLSTQRRMFREAYHSALVIDPIRKRVDVFALRHRATEPRPFAIWKPSPSVGSLQRPEARSARTRTSTTLTVGSTPTSRNSFRLAGTGTEAR